MVKGYDYENEKIRRIAVDANGILKTKPEGVYLAVLPDLDDGEQHRLILTVDGKLMTYDPVIDGKVDDIEDKLDEPTHGLQALEDLNDELIDRLITGLQTDMALSDHLLAGNIIRNPGFETGDGTGWTITGTGSHSVQGVTVKHGSWALDMFPDANLAYSAYNNNQIPCYAGRRVRVQAWLKADANINLSYLYINWWDAAGGYMATTYSPDYGGNYDWAFRKLVLTAPDGAYFFNPGVQFNSGGVAGHGYVDSALVPQAPMDGELHEYAVHVSDIFPDDTNKTVTTISGGAAHAWGAWANLADSAAGLLSTAFAASDGYLAAIHIEDCDLTDNLYMLELRDNVTGLTLGRLRFSKELNKADVGHAIRIRSIRIPAGADIEYRQKDATGGGEAEIHVRYYLV